MPGSSPLAAGHSFIPLALSSFTNVPMPLAFLFRELLIDAADLSSPPMISLPDFKSGHRI